VRYQTTAFPEGTAALKREHYSPDSQNAELGIWYLGTRKIPKINRCPNWGKLKKKKREVERKVLVRPW